MIDKRIYGWLRPHFKELYTSHKLGPEFEGLQYKIVNGEHHRARRIDFIGKTHRGAWVAIELEHGDNFNQITGGIAQLEDFYECLKNGVYCITPSSEKIKIDYFLLLTKYVDVTGYLYGKDKQSNFYVPRMMWGLIARDRENMANSSTEGLKRFGIIEKDSWDGEPIACVENKKMRLRDLCSLS